MKLSIYVVAGGLLLFSAFSSCSKKSDRTACQQLDEIDLKMLNIIDQINEEYKDDKVFIKAFKDAQIYWIQYRNRQVKAVFPLPPKKYDYNVGECKCEIYRDLTKLRVKELQKWLDGVSGDVTCRGTYKAK